MKKPQLAFIQTAEGYLLSVSTLVETCRSDVRPTGEAFIAAATKMHDLLGEMLSIIEGGGSATAMLLEAQLAENQGVGGEI